MNLFAHPIYLLYLLPTLVGVFLVLWAGQKLKKRLIGALFGALAYRKLTQQLRSVSRWRMCLLLAAVVFLFVALAGPQWGREVVETEGLFSQAVIAVDVSSSMRAQDLKPNRLENAKQMLQMIISHLKQERLGIIAFTSQAFIQCPITTDTDALNYFVSVLQPDMLPVKGTSLFAPVALSAQMLQKYAGYKALILLTDGEDHSPDELSKARQLAQENGIRIIAVGIGTQDGALIPTRLDNQGHALDYKKDKNGKTVTTKLDEKTLVELAKDTGGAYIAYTTPAQVAYQIETALKGLDKSVSKSAAHAIYKNRYAFPLVLAILCLSGFLLWPRGKYFKKDVKKVQ